MKNWKNPPKIRVDFDNRDKPCMYWQGHIYMGNKGSSHATMVQEMVYCMGFADYESEYSDNWNDRETSIMFRRDELWEIDDELYLFGHVIGSSIYWDIYDDDRYLELIPSILLDKKYKHFGINLREEVSPLHKYIKSSSIKYIDNNANNVVWR